MNCLIDTVDKGSHPVLYTPIFGMFRPIIVHDDGGLDPPVFDVSALTKLLIWFDRDLPK